MDSAPKRPWYRLHWVTWLAIAMVMGAFAWRESAPREIASRRRISSFGDFSFTEREYGWPLVHLRQSEKTTTVDSGAKTIDEVTLIVQFTSTTTVSRQWNCPMLVSHLGFGILLIGAVGCVVERRLRRAKPWQFSIRSFLILFTIVSILLALALRPFAEWTTKPMLLVSPIDFVNPLRWPLLFALACTIYSLGWLVCFVVLRCWSLVRRVRT